MNKFDSYINWINEKFIEDSDPIDDLGIGMKKILEPFSILKCSKNLLFREDEQKYLKSIFGPNYEKEVYFLYDSGNYTYEYPLDYYNIIHKKLTNKNLINHAKLPGEHLYLYQTSLGKILKINDSGLFCFLAEIDVAADLYIKYLK